MQQKENTEHSTFKSFANIWKKRKSLYWNIVIIGSAVSRARVAVHANDASKRKSLLEFDCLHWIYTANNASVTGTTYVCVCWMTGNRALLLECWKTFFAALWHLSPEGKDSACPKPSSALQPWPASSSCHIEAHCSKWENERHKQAVSLCPHREPIPLSFF